MPPSDPVARALLDAFAAEARERYSEGIGHPGDPAAPLRDPEAQLYLLRDPDGATVGCGGVRRLGGGIGEIKRMYVVPEFRGRGCARELLAALEGAARELGFERARLDTGPRQPRALRLYRRAGYAEIENFNENPMATFFGEKRLVAGRES